MEQNNLPFLQYIQQDFFWRQRKQKQPKQISRTGTDSQN